MTTSERPDLDAIEAEFDRSRNADGCDCGNPPRSVERAAEHIPALLAYTRTLEDLNAGFDESNSRLHGSWKVLNNRSADALAHYTGQRLPGLVADRMARILRGEEEPWPPATTA